MTEQFKSLNGLRLFAALAVVFFHYSQITSQFKTLPHFLQNCVRSGSISLGFFYALSGFVLAHAYRERLPRSSQMRTSFWFARIARLYPVYVLAFVLFLPMAYEKYLHNPAPGINGPRTFLVGGTLALLAIQSWTPLSQAWNGPSWSLSVEAFFYAMFPFIAGPIRRAPAGRIVILVFGLWLPMASIAVAHFLYGFLSYAFWTDWVMYNPLFWSPLFIMGIATYRLSSWWNTVGGVTASIAAGSLILLLIALCCLLAKPWAGILVSGGAGPLLALIVLTFAHSGSPMARVMGIRPLNIAGAASYVIYILQAPIWHAFRMATDHLRHVSAGTPPTAWQFLAYLALLLPLALGVQDLVEKPAQRYLLAWRKSKLTAQFEPATAIQA